MYDAAQAVIKPKWSLDILNLLAEKGTLQYTEIEAEFQTSPDVISSRLRLLQEYNLITRTERSKRDVRYSITEDGRLILQHIRSIDDCLSE